MATTAEIMDALAVQLASELATVDGIQVVGRLWWNPTPPCIDIYPASPAQGADAFGGTKELYMIVRARINTPDSEGAQEVLLGMMDPTGPDSVEAAIEADDTLGGVVQYAHVMPDSPSGFEVFGVPGGGDLLGSTWRVRIEP
jgi:hypothetical protein